MSDLVGHFLLFTVIGIVFLMLPLVLGLFVRPTNPTTEKQTAYECGEPSIGTAYIQFDLRFYVVALLFIIFDVEVAFFFPWAAVYGSAVQLADSRLSDAGRLQWTEKLLNLPQGSATLDNAISSGTAFQLMQIGLVDLLVFFGVLLVGFAYVWKRGDLDWVRAMAEKAKLNAAQKYPGGTPTTVNSERKYEPVA